MFLLSNSLNNLNANNIIVAHVNYNIRKSAKRDFDIIKNFCFKKNIIFQYSNYKNLNRNNVNFEKDAREYRYNFFKKISLKFNCEGVLIGHNFTDKLETYIFQKERNIVPDFYGLKEINYIFNIKVFRIMLSVSRDFIYEYLKTKEIPFGIDETNDDLKYSRNKIRKNLDNYNFLTLTKEIEQKNNKLNLIKNHIYEHFYLQIDFYLKLEFHFQQQAIKNLLNFKNIFTWNKKGKFLYEITKKTLPFKERRVIEINNDFCLVTNYDHLKILDAKKLENIRIEWTHKNFNILITNELEYYKKYFIGNKNLKELFIRNKLNLDFLRIPTVFIENQIVWISPKILNNLNNYDKKRIIMNLKINFLNSFNF